METTLILPEEYWPYKDTVSQTSDFELLCYMPSEVHHHYQQDATEEMTTPKFEDSQIGQVYLNIETNEEFIMVSDQMFISVGMELVPAVLLFNPESNVYLTISIEDFREQYAILEA